MKNNQIISILLIAILTITAAGCAETAPTESDVAQLNQEKTDEVLDYEEEPVPHVDTALIMWLDEVDDIKSELINEIENLRKAGGDIDKISEITKFYYPVIEMDGFELFCFSVDEAGFVYYYASIDPDKKENVFKAGEYFFSDKTDIEIIIERPESRLFDGDDIIDYLKELAEIDNVSLTEDNFVHTSQYNSIFGQIGDTIFRITVPDKMNDYETLRDLANQLIKSAELVNVQQELDVMRNSTD